jgi:leucyl-tRNA synthetase
MRGSPEAITITRYYLPAPTRAPTLPHSLAFHVSAVLANEEVIDGLSERGSHPVVRMPMKQWMLKITAYGDRWGGQAGPVPGLQAWVVEKQGGLRARLPPASAPALEFPLCSPAWCHAIPYPHAKSISFPPCRLLSDLEGLDWADSIKEMQRNWIGRSEGATIRFQLAPGEGSTVQPGAPGGCSACAAAAAACLHFLCV